MTPDKLLSTFFLWIPSIGIFTLAISVFLVYRRFILHPKTIDISKSRRLRHLILIGICLFFLVLVLLSLPVSESLKGQLFSLLGIALTATIALSSTTFVGNTMAGFMLRAIDAIRPGDFLRASGHMGRVTEQGLLHTEIQTEDRDLTTLPNLFLVTNPVTVVRSSGTIISATVSRGYDVPRTKIENLLLEAGHRAELKDPFVQILELGDFSVTYRIAGFLSEVKYMLSARSRLRSLMLDVLHEGGVEIVSPNFMNQRALDPKQPFIPHIQDDVPSNTTKAPEHVIFDKAEDAESLEEVKARYQATQEELERLMAEFEQSKNDTTKEKIERTERKLEFLTKLIKSKEEKL
jgi:small-conductance mechanosensitive channel